MKLRLGHEPPAGDRQVFPGGIAGASLKFSCNVPCCEEEKCFPRRNRRGLIEAQTPGMSILGP